MTILQTYLKTNPVDDHKVSKENKEPIRAIAKAFMDRVAQTQMIGHERDVEALAFFFGASVACKATGQFSLSEDIAKIAVLEISPRGFTAVMDLALF